MKIRLFIRVTLDISRKYIAITLLRAFLLFLPIGCFIIIFIFLLFIFRVFIYIQIIKRCKKYIYIFAALFRRYIRMHGASRTCASSFGAYGHGISRFDIKAAIDYFGLRRALLFLAASVATLLLPSGGAGFISLDRKLDGRLWLDFLLNIFIT